MKQTVSIPDIEALWKVRTINHPLNPWVHLIDGLAWTTTLKLCICWDGKKKKSSLVHTSQIHLLQTWNIIGCYTLQGLQIYPHDSIPQCLLFIKQIPCLSLCACVTPSESECMWKMLTALNEATDKIIIIIKKTFGWQQLFNVLSPWPLIYTSNTQGKGSYPWGNG